MDITNTELSTKGNSQGFIVDRGLVKSGKKIHGQNPANLIPKIIREKILDSIYWKLIIQDMNLYQLIDECVTNVQMIGVYSNNIKTKPSNFICLLLRLIHLDPTTDIIEYLINGPSQFKYLKALAIAYYRLVTESDIDIWTQLEPQLSNFNKLRVFNPSKGICSLMYFDEFVDLLLTEGKLYEMVFPRLVKRVVLEESGLLEPRESSIMDEFDDLIDQEVHSTT